MMSSKTSHIYKIILITDSRENILGMYFTKEHNESLQIIEWDLKNKKNDENLRLAKKIFNRNYYLSLW